MIKYDVNAVCGPPDDYIQVTCCSPAYKIGYSFPFGCDTYDSFVVSSTPSITFNTSNSGACWDFGFPSFSPFINFDVILNNGSVYGHMLVENGEDVLVIEWTGIYLPFPPYVHFGTVQLWLFQNGTIGVIYHLTGQFFSATAAYWTVPRGSGYNISFAGDVALLRGGEAYLFVPDASVCCAAYKQKVWKHPPNECLTPFNVSAANGDDHGLFVPPVDCNLTNSADLSYCSGRGLYPNDAYDPTGITYTPLMVCPADLTIYAVFNGTFPPPGPPPRSGHSHILSGGAIGAITVASFFFLVIIGVIISFANN
jgi:hypothetical protein